MATLALCYISDR